MTDASLKAAREFLAGYVNLAQLDPAIDALSALLDSWAERQHRATAEKCAIRLDVTRDLLWPAQIQKRLREDIKLCRVVRDAPPPEPTE
jgi:hypothetical protein